MNTTTRPRAARRAIGAIGAALASALMMIPCTTVIAAETGVPLDAAHFPDEAFRSVVQQYDTNNNGTLSQQELTAVTTIDVTGCDIKSAKGIEYFTALDWLYLGGNQLSSVDLSHNTKLTQLYLDSNQLSSLDVSHNTALEWLYLGNNQLSSVDLSHNTALTYLWLYNNQLSSVDVSHNTALEYLDLTDNQLSSVDVSHNTALKWPGLSGNRLLWVGGVANSINLDLSDQREFGPVAASSLDLAKAAPGIDVSRISNVQGGKLKGTVLTPTNASGLVTYDYRFSDASEPLHAQVRFDAPSFTVAFDTNGGSGNTVVSVVSGKTVTAPAAPTRTGYTFNGWYTAKDGGSKYDFSKPVTGNLTLYAHWTANTPAKITFRDVSGSTPHVDDIRWLADRGISTGWKEADGSFTFRGMSPVVRQDMAAFLRREARNRGVADAASWQPSAADWKRFRDVDRNTPHAEDILWLAHAGISTGWKEKDGTATFRGMSPVVRQDMAAFLKRLADKADKADGVTPKTDFTDVTNRTPHVAEVQWLGGSGISQGYRNANGTWRFEGMTPVYRQDMAAFIHRLDNLFNCERNKTLIKDAWTETVNHPAEEKVVTPGHYETVIIKDKEWVPPVTKEEPVYETQNVEMYRFPDGYERPSSQGGVTWEEMDAHGYRYSTYYKTTQVQTGTTTVIVTPGYWTDPVTEQKWVDPVTETIPAWTETIEHPAEYKITLVNCRVA